VIIVPLLPQDIGVGVAIGIGIEFFSVKKNQEYRLKQTP
jgi:hypothetical protein